MKYRKIPGLSNQISEIGFGGAAVSGEGKGYGFGNINESDSIDLLMHAKQCGVTLYDTAPIYGFGLSERRIGKAFRSCREDIVIVSKSGITWDDNKRVDRNNDPKVAEKMLHQSLTDLQSDYIDIYMIHWPDERNDIRKAMEVLSKAKGQGKIRSIGLCNTNLVDLQLAGEIDTIDCIQGPLNMFTYEQSTALFSFIKEQNIGFMGYGTFDKGILTGRVDKNRKFDKSDARSWAPWWKKYDKSFKYKAMEKLDQWIKDKPFTLVSLAAHFSLSFEQATTALCGTRSIHQLDNLLKDYESIPTKEDLAEAMEICDFALKNK